ERDVDLVLGPYPTAPGELKLDPEKLSEAQRAALSRATCAACEWRLVVDQGVQIGDDDYLPLGVGILRRAAAVSPRMLEELVGSGSSPTPPTTPGPGAG